MTVWEATGYHTTHSSNGEAILREGFRVNDNGEDTWLGEGVYFWSELQDAQSWARIRRMRNKYVILASKITVAREHVLDLSTQESLELFETMYNVLVGGEERAEASFADCHALDRAIIEALSLQHEWKVIVFGDNWNQSPDYVRGRDKGNMPRSYILDQNTRRRIIYCVRDTECIGSTTIVNGVARDGTAAAKDAGGY